MLPTGGWLPVPGLLSLTVLTARDRTAFSSILLPGQWSNLQRDTSATAQRRLLKLNNMSGRHRQRFSDGLRSQGTWNKTIAAFQQKFYSFLSGITLQIANFVFQFQLLLHPHNKYSNLIHL